MVGSVGNDLKFRPDQRMIRRPLVDTIRIDGFQTASENPIDSTSDWIAQALGNSVVNVFASQQIGQLRVVCGCVQIAH